MSFYTESVKTNIIQPRYHSNARTEFTIGSGLYLANMRLLSLGALSDATADFSFPAFSGVMSLIKAIHLYDGQNIISSLRDVDLTSALSNLMSQNSYNRNVKDYLKGTKLGFGVDRRNDFRMQDGRILSYVDNSLNPTDNLANTMKSWIALSDLLGILRGNPMFKEGSNMISLANAISGQVFKDLRLVIEYNNLDNVVAGTTTGPVQSNSASAVLEPILVVDEIVNNNTVRQWNNDYMGHQYYDIENTTVVNSAVGAGENTKEFRLTAFRNKIVKNFIMQNVPSELFVPAVFPDVVVGRCSHALWQEKIELTLNDQSLIPLGAIDDSNVKLGYTTDALGGLNVAPGMHNYLEQDNQLNQLMVEDAVPRKLIRQASFLAVKINQMVDEIRIKHTRTGIAGFNDNNQSINVLCHAEVLKMVEVSPASASGYVISY